MSTGKNSLVAGLFNQNSPVPKKPVHLSSYSPSQGIKAAHSSSSKRKLDDENDLNVSNEIIDQIATDKEPSVWSTNVRKSSLGSDKSLSNWD